MATILVVDDDAQIRSLLEDLLERRGYQVLTAGTGPAALEIATAQPHPVDFLITDIQMPGMSGPQLVERFTTCCPLAKVLYISGEEPPPTVCDQVAQGRAVFLEKSGDLLRFVTTIGRLLGSSPSDGVIAVRDSPQQDPTTWKDRRSGRERRSGGERRLGHDRRCHVMQWTGEDRRRGHERRQGVRREGYRRVASH